MFLVVMPALQKIVAHPYRSSGVGFGAARSLPQLLAMTPSNDPGTPAEAPSNQLTSAISGRAISWHPEADVLDSQHPSVSIEKPEALQVQPRQDPGKESAAEAPVAPSVTLKRKRTPVDETDVNRLLEAQREQLKSAPLHNADSFTLKSVVEGPELSEVVNHKLEHLKRQAKRTFVDIPAAVMQGSTVGLIVGVLSSFIWTVTGKPELFAQRFIKRSLLLGGLGALVGGVNRGFHVAQNEAQNLQQLSTEILDGVAELKEKEDAQAADREA